MNILLKILVYCSIVLCSCSQQGVKMEFHYKVLGEQGGLTQELKFDGVRGFYFAFDRSVGTVYEGEFDIPAVIKKRIEGLVSEIGDYACKSIVAADNQVIEIFWGKTRIVCSEAQLGENKKLRDLVQQVRFLIGQQIKSE